jgi:hypothetical protein
MTDISIGGNAATLALRAAHLFIAPTRSKKHYRTAPQNPSPKETPEAQPAMKKPRTDDGGCASIEEDRTSDVTSNLGDLFPSIHVYPERWKNALLEGTRHLADQRKHEAESVGIAWQASLEIIQKIAKTILNHPRFIADNWPLFSARPVADVRIMRLSSASTNALTVKERQFFDMLENPQRMATCEVPFYLVQNIPGIAYLTIHGKQLRPLCSIRGLGRNASVASVLFRVAYPESVFTPGHHMSHLQTNIGTLARFCVAPRFLALESRQQNVIRSGCDARWEQIIERNKKACIQEDVEISFKALLLLSAKEAQRHVCCSHDQPPCVFDVDHPHHHHLLLQISRWKPVLQTEDKEVSKAIRISRCHEMKRGSESDRATKEGFGKTDNIVGKNCMYKCLKCGHLQTLCNLKKAGHGNCCTA